MMKRNLKLGVIVLTTVFGTSIVGCDNAGPKTHDVHGIVKVERGDASQLVGHIVELASVDDQTVRASGVINANGQFQLETLDQGKTNRGAREGQYQARLVIVNEGDGQTKRPKIAARYLDFKSSGWSVQVPASGDVTLNVAGK